MPRIVIEVDGKLKKALQRKGITEGKNMKELLTPVLECLVEKKEARK